MKQTQNYINKLDLSSRITIIEFLVDKNKTKVGLKNVKLLTSKNFVANKDDEFLYTIDGTKSLNTFKINGYFKDGPEKTIKGKVELFDFGFDLKIGNKFVVSAVEFPDYAYIDAVLKQLGIMSGNGNDDAKYLKEFLSLRNDLKEQKTL